MKKFLSIDWDYFIDASAVERALKFPDGGNENLPLDIQSIIWQIRYHDNPDILSIKVHDHFSRIIKVLAKFLMFTPRNPVDSKHKVLASKNISHKYAYQFILDRTQPGEHFEVYNIDFHHDMYYYSDSCDPVNCGNWVRELLKERPGMQYYWVKREDSETSLLGGDEIPENIIVPFEKVEEQDFDYVFMCRSDMWSPPHLDSKFEVLCNLFHLSAIKAETKDRLESVDRSPTFK